MEMEGKCDNYRNKEIIDKKKVIEDRNQNKICDNYKNKRKKEKKKERIDNNEGNEWGR